ncbi:uncharacterized protein BJ212DRAFT_1299879 [Suillus subaureus]|uniref:Uncharacterized protein n=1 Tax=Suillus subaureus TaxID=48587 RepID=A0A9P7JDI8_9AGAM|nr:uncharacterized protein BJ212DRAFT_1299879 [Suillus subaureus]KAG1816030.1 hypothetical protein BJ212DRAFT_1299879 [Suillus subaureus]
MINQQDPRLCMKHMDSLLVTDQLDDKMLDGDKMWIRSEIQICEYDREYTRVTLETGYPLKPGTAAIASKTAYYQQTMQNDSHAKKPPEEQYYMSQYMSAWIKEILEQEEGKVNGSA